jgi:hypothetical protein
MSSISRFNRVIFNLINLNTEISKQAKLRCYKEVNAFSVSLMNQHETTNNRLNELEEQIKKLSSHLQVQGEAQVDSQSHMRGYDFKPLHPCTIVNKE